MTCLVIVRQELENAVQNTSMHELAHQWWVNAPMDGIGGSGGHDVHSEWNSNRPCLMHFEPVPLDDEAVIRRFHDFRETFNDLLCIRYREKNFLDDSDVCNLP